MTTSFSHFVRGQFTQSIRANAAGTLLAVVSVVLMLWLFASAWAGRYLGVSDPIWHLAWGLTGLAILTLVHWAIRLMTD